MSWNWKMKPYEDRAPDTQYRDRLLYILEHGNRKEQTMQGVPQIVCLHVPSMVFDLANGVPLINEREIPFWRSAIGELCAFINGAKTQKELREFGCSWWKPWVTKEKCSVFGLEEGELGPGSYGAAFANFPMPNGDSWNQWEAIVAQITACPWLATHEISPWIPFYTTMGANRKVVVAPCHGWVHFEVLNDRLHLVMRQRSADFPVGVPANMIQYAAILLAVARITNQVPGCFIHQFCNAHIYANQMPWVKKMVEREARALPTLSLVEPFPDRISDVRKEHFAISDYFPHEEMPDIPVAV